MNESILNMIVTIIPIIGAILTYFIVPYIKASVGTEKLVHYKEWAALAVKSAEMIWTETGQGEDKKTYVVDFLNSMFNSKKTVLTKEQLHVLIESAVLALKNSSIQK